MYTSKKNSLPHQDGWLALTEEEHNKCMQKFEAYKALGSTMLSKNELRRMLMELGKQIGEQELLQMIYMADPNGHGYITFAAFENMVTDYKQHQEEEVSNPMALTYDLILEAYQNSHPTTSSHYSIPWKFIEDYLEDNFGIKANLKNLKTLHPKAQLTRSDFKQIFA